MAGETLGQKTERMYLYNVRRLARQMGVWWHKNRGEKVGRAVKVKRQGCKRKIKER